MTAPSRVVAVHGFMFSADGGPDDPDKVFRPEIEAAIGTPVDLFRWYSLPFGYRAAAPLASIWQTLRAWGGAWAHGHAHPYRYAWSLATEAGTVLATQLRARHAASGERVILVAHSLGSRVALRAAALAPQAVERMVLLSGAELVRNADVVAGLLRIQTLNVVTDTDDVLRVLGAHCGGDGDGACIGQAGLPDPPPNWLNLRLDDPATQAIGRRLGWDLQGDKPGEWGDHWHCYRHPGNWPAIRAWLGGGALAAFRPPGNLAEAGEDCRGKLRAVKEVVGPP